MDGLGRLTLFLQVEEAGSFFLTDALVRNDILKEFTTSRILHNQEQLFF